MKYSNTATLAILLSSISCSSAFSPSTTRNSRSIFSSTSKLFATVEEEKTEQSTTTEKTPTTATDGEKGSSEIDPNAEGLPWWWDLVWKLDVMQPGETGTDCTFGDSANVLKNILNKFMVVIPA